MGKVYPGCRAGQGRSRHRGARPGPQVSARRSTASRGELTAAAARGEKKRKEPRASVRVVSPRSLAGCHLRGMDGARPSALHLHAPPLSPWREHRTIPPSHLFPRVTHLLVLLFSAPAAAAALLEVLTHDATRAANKGSNERYTMGGPATPSVARRLFVPSHATGGGPRASQTTGSHLTGTRLPPGPRVPRSTRPGYVCLTSQACIYKPTQYRERIPYEYSSRQLHDCSSVLTLS